MAPGDIFGKLSARVLAALIASQLVELILGDQRLDDGNICDLVALRLGIGASERAGRLAFASMASSCVFGAPFGPWDRLSKAGDGSSMSSGRAGFEAAR
jgi:hypothetical protein